jgi:hypothetical protein
VPHQGTVIVSLSGGLGNQLFQYAAARTIAEERGATLQVVGRRDVPSRTVVLRDVLDVPKAELTPRERLLGGLPDAPLERSPIVVKQLAKTVGRRLARYHVVRQSMLEMAHPKVTLAARYRYVHLQGLFQHPTWYEPSLDAVVDGLVHKLHEQLDLRAGDGTLAVHFRRGDYVLNGYELPMSFYDDAVRAVTDCSTVSRVLVMSDDHDFGALAAEHFRASGLPATPLPLHPERSDIDDFLLLAAAQHVVMSNSTFVWWATVVGDRLRSGARVVICPSPWMPARAAGTIPAATLDIARPNWALHLVRP